MWPRWPPAHMSGQPTIAPGTPLRWHKPAWVFACMALLPGLVTSAAAETGRRDPEFSRLPFGQWLSEGESAGIIGWSAEILPAEISTHQRLMLRVVIRVDGRVLENRRGSGEFVTLVQYRDNNDAIWQHHTSLDLTKLSSAVGAQQIAIAQYAFVLPGDYSLAIAVCDTATLEHSLIFREVHAEPLKSDPLQNAWAGLPAVEFLPAITDPPDVWYLPGIEQRLHLSVPTRRQVHIHLLVNTTPSTRVAGSGAAMRNNMSAVIPALKVLSQIDVPKGSIDAAFLDLTHRRVTFEQKDVRTLSWDGIRKIFLQARPGVIDVQGLQGQSKMQQFFRDEVSRRLSIEERHGSERVFEVVIILSGAAFLEDQEPSALPAPPVDPDHKLFYVRFVSSPVPPKRSRAHRGAKPIPAEPVPVDDLEHTVEPLKAQLYEATSEEAFRKILADMIDQISRI